MVPDHDVTPQIENLVFSLLAEFFSWYERKSSRIAGSSRSDYWLFFTSDLWLEWMVDSVLWASLRRIPFSVVYASWNEEEKMRKNLHSMAGVFGVLWLR